MSITSAVSVDQKVVTISVSGRFDFAMHQEFMSAYRDYPGGEVHFVVDLSGVEYLDSSALGMLLQLREHGHKGREVELVNGNQGVKEILRIANFEKLFKVA